jgi:hypothetical protein
LTDDLDATGVGRPNLVDEPRYQSRVTVGLPLPPNTINPGILSAA